MKSRNLKRNLGIVLSLCLAVSMSQGKVVASIPERNSDDILKFCGIKDDEDNDKVNRNNKRYSKTLTKRLLP